MRGWPADWHPIVRVCLAVSALVIAFAIWGRSERPRSQAARPLRPPHLLDYLTVGIAILCIECFFLVFLSLAPSKTEYLALALDQSLHPEIYQNTTDPNSNQKNAPATPGSEGPRTTSNWLFSGPGPRSLNKNDKVTPSNRPELYLFPTTKEDASRLLSSELFLRSFTLATYRGGSWFPKATIPRTLTATNSSIARPLAKPTPPGSSVSYDISHPASPFGQTLAVTIPDFSSISLPSLREISPDTFRLPSSEISKSTYRYQVASTLFRFEQVPQNAPILASSAPSAPSAHSDYLTLPSDPALRQKIKTLAARFGPASRDALLQLREDLRTRYRYSLQVNMPDETDPLDSFLFGTRIGYCTHFATATAMLTRAMGIPSRIAFGWSGGRYFEGPKLFVFRAREAHAWTEIHLPDLGWVIFETTPASRDEGSSSLADLNEKPPLEDLLELAEEDTPAQLLAPLRRAASLVGLAALIALLITLFLRRSGTPAAPPSPALQLLPSTPHYLSAFRRACLAHGQPMPLSRTLRSHLSLIEAPDFTHDLLTYHYAVQYGQSSRSKTTEKQLLHQLKAWEKSATPTEKS